MTHPVEQGKGHHARQMVCQAVTQRYGHRSLYEDLGNPKKVTGQIRVPFYDAVFTAVYGNHEQGENAIEDRTFWEATPQGEFKVSTVKEMPWEPGQAYYIDVTEAPA